MNLILGICGCVQANNSIDFLRILLDKASHIDINVEVVASPNSIRFFEVEEVEALTGNKVFVSHMDQSDAFQVPHVQLSQWADLVVVYPISANTISKASQGMCDNLLTNVLMTFKNEILIGPCMNDAMYDNPFVQQNIEKLKSQNYEVIPRVKHPVFIHAEQKTVVKDYCSVDSAVLTTLKAILKKTS